MPLDRWHEAFAQAVAAGQEPEVAYAVSRVGVLGISLPQVQTPIVRARIDELRKARAATERGELTLGNATREDVFRMLVEDRNAARGVGQFGVAAKCDELMGKAIGMFTEQPPAPMQVQFVIRGLYDSGVVTVVPRVENC